MKEGREGEGGGGEREAGGERRKEDPTHNTYTHTCSTRLAFSWDSVDCTNPAANAASIVCVERGGRDDD